MLVKSGQRNVTHLSQYPESRCQSPTVPLVIESPQQSQAQKHRIQTVSSGKTEVPRGLEDILCRSETSTSDRLGVDSSVIYAMVFLSESTEFGPVNRL